MQGLVPSPGILVGQVGPPRAVIPPAFALTQPLPLCFLSGLVPGIVLRVCPGESRIFDVDGTTLIITSPRDRPSWAPCLQGLS